MGEVDLHAEVVAALWLYDVWAVFPFEHVLCTVFDEFGVAFYCEGDEYLGFGGWGRDVEGYVVEVGHNLVDGGGCCAGGRWSAVGGELAEC